MAVEAAVKGDVSLLKLAMLHDPLTDLPFAVLLPRPADLPFDPPATPASSCPHLTRVRGVSVAPAGEPFHSQ